MKRKSSLPSGSAIARQLKALRMRVSFLEQALKPRKKRTLPKEELNQARERAEEKARTAAMLDYYQQRKIDFYLRNPDWLAKDLAREEDIAAYLRSRGITPEPSSIPEQFRRGLKKYQPATRSPKSPA